MKKSLKQVRGQKQVREWKQAKDRTKGSLYQGRRKHFVIGQANLVQQDWY